MPVFRLAPACKDYLWGGNRIRDKYHIVSDMNPLAEAWVFSTNENGSSVIASGKYAGMSLREYFRSVSNARDKDLPVLIKFLDAKKSLSVQVHPDDITAKLLGESSGKTEFIYILEADPGSELIYGLEKEITREEWERHIREGTVMDAVHHEPVKKGDGYFVPAGVVHGYGAGILALEIQQNSDVTYRIYDYGRLGKDGKPRKLHLKEASAATHLGPVRDEFGFDGHLVSCPYFTTDRYTDSFEGSADISYVSLIVTEGSFEIQNGEDVLTGNPGDSFFIPEGSGTYCVKGSGEIFKTVK